MEDDLKAIVTDFGSYTKAGLATEDEPRAIFETVVGRAPNWNPKSTLMFGMGLKDGYVGDEAFSKCGILRIHRPVVRGIPSLSIPENLEKVWHHTFFNELRRAPEESFLFNVEPVSLPLDVKLYNAQLAFETFQFPGYATGVAGCMAVYAASGGKTPLTGLSIDLGSSTITITPVYEGQAIQWASRTIPFGGIDLTAIAMNFLNERGYCFTTSAEREVARDIRERLGAVVMDPEELYKNDPLLFREETYEMPDGTFLKLRDEMPRCYESIFSSFGQQELPLHEHVNEIVDKFRPLRHNDTALIDSLNRSENSLFSSLPNEIYRMVRSYCMPFDYMVHDMLSNIVLSGEVSLVPGLAQRLKKELQQLVPPSTKIQVTARDDRRHLAWTGGALVARLTFTHPMWTLKTEWDEVGPAIVKPVQSMNSYPLVECKS